MKELEIPQREVPVTVELRDGRRIDGALFEVPAGPPGARGRLLARLNDDDDDFVPFASAGGRELLNRAWLVTVDLDLAELDPVLGAESEHALRIELCTGKAIEGVVRYAMRAERCRLLDYLNAAPRFIALHSGDRATLVQRACIVRVENPA